MSYHPPIEAPYDPQDPQVRRAGGASAPAPPLAHDGASAPEAAGGALVVRGRPGAQQLAVLRRGARASLPKALLGAHERLEAAAQRAAETWTGGGVTLEGQLGAVLIQEGDRTLVVWFHRARPNGVGLPPRDSADRGAGAEARAVAPDLNGWELCWMTPALAALELSQLEERRLVTRELCARSLRTRAAALLPATAPDRWLALGLAGSTLCGVVAAWLGWLNGAEWSLVYVPRLALVALFGGLTGAASKGACAQGAPLLGALAGALVGSLLAAALASGALAGVSLSGAGALVCAWAAAWFTGRSFLAAGN
ncbi:MAG: hypothetical protein R3F49_19235 [Planctomycetota bacterium]